MLVADGDSITAGTGDTPYPGLLSVPAAWSVHNVAIGGQTLAVAIPAAPTTVDTLFGGALNPNICSVWLGTDDIEGNGTSPAATYVLLTQYIQARHAKGWKVITATMLSRTNFETQKNAYNALILANTAGADAVVDFTGTVLGCDGCATNLTYFLAGGVHPNQNGVTTVEVPLFQAAINSLTFSAAVMPNVQEFRANVIPIDRGKKRHPLKKAA